MPDSTDEEENAEEGWQQEEDVDDDDPSNGLPDQQRSEDYDPNADDADQTFIDRARGNRRSDALLSCPGCLTTVCIDCQAHAYKDGQFRAMFSINTRVDKSRQVSSTTPTGRREKRRRGQEQAGREVGASEQPLSAVVCNVCGVLVGAQDSDEIFHFFHVVASTA